jgi:NAD(P)-dependent dehydrogenase (short-subunit alcohol dehydrogenase family)
MVDITAVRLSNAQYAAAGHSGLVCVFAGATAGIGYATLQVMATLLENSNFYVLGRSQSRHEAKLDHLQDIAPSCKFIFIETQVSLISGIDDACKRIVAAEEKIDYLCMSLGGMPFQGAVCKYQNRDFSNDLTNRLDTEEGLETCFAVSYYSRLRLVWNLLPLLNRSENPRVLSILNGTKEKRIDESDIGLEKQWGIVAVVNHTTLLTSLAFDYLAEHDDKKHITCIHATPGFVHIDTARTAFPSKQNGWWHWALVSTLQIVSGWIIHFFGLPAELPGQRHAYHLTSDNFRPGLWRVDRHSDVVPDNDVLREYLQKGRTEKAWEHTQRAWDKPLAVRTSD